MTRTGIWARGLLCLMVFACARAPVAIAEANDPVAAADSGWGDDWGDSWGETDSSDPGPDGSLVWSGFAEGAAGGRTNGSSDPTGATLGEFRIRAETEWVNDRLTLSFKGEALGDRAMRESTVMLRDLTLRVPIGSQVDLKVGRQVLTWGTGDLLFLNDLFPKDFVSFFAGRDDDYLKAPTDAIRVTTYHDTANVDLVWMPFFRPDTYLDGSRFSFYNPVTQEIEAPDPVLHPELPEQTPANGELAIRLFRQQGAFEYALYGYRGFFRQPVAVTETGRPTFAPLTVTGGSVRGPIGPGIANAEIAWYDSKDDNNGRDPRIPNSQGRWLIGYERELITHLTGALQVYGERILDYANLKAAAPPDAALPDENRTVITSRLTYRAMLDRLTLSLFAFASPTDRDWHLRPSVTWRMDDQWQFTAGMNLLGGAHEWTFFGQLEENSNAYLRVRRYY